MVVLNNLDRFQLALDAICRILAHRVEAEAERHAATMQRHKHCIAEQGEVLPEICDWRWSA